MERRGQGEFTWVDLTAKDLETQSRFYEELFGWTHRDTSSDEGFVYRMFDLDGAVVAGASQMNPQMEASGTPTMWNLHVATPSADAIAGRATQLGGRVIMPAADAMGWGRIVAIEDPTGGTIFFWEARKHVGSSKFNEPGAFTWADFNTRLPEEAVSFFTDLLGWKIERTQDSDTPFWTISVDGKLEGGITTMPDQMPAEVPPSWLVYFGVADAQAAVDRAESMGATVKMGPLDAGMTQYAVLTDPAGAVFAIMTPFEE